jgi:hypothetical protein
VNLQVIACHNKLKNGPRKKLRFLKLGVAAAAEKGFREANHI